jgi:3-hydroxyacyl-CoA dehydrogenase
MRGQVHRTTSDGIAILEIDNPPLNIMSQQTRRALWDALTRADAEPEIRAIVILARGPTFVTGIDLTELGQKPREPPMPDVTDRIEAAARPVVVGWHGQTLGAGCEIGLAAHRRIMARSATLALPDVRCGLVPGAGGTQRLPRLIGLVAALDIIASGRTLDAMEAFALGLCDEVTDGDIEAACLAAARELAGKLQPRLSLRPVTAPEPAAWEAMVQKVRREARGRIAPLRAIELVGQTLTAPYAIGGPAERRAFLDLSASDQSRAFRHLFFAERRAKKSAEDLIGAAGVPTTIGIAGLGQTGAALAATLLEHGLTVIAFEPVEPATGAGRERIAGFLARAMKAGRIAAAERSDLTRRLTLAQDVSDLAPSDLVIEAMPEDGTLKGETLARLEAALPASTPIATTGAGRDAADLPALARHPDRLIALHAFAPVQVTRIVEVARGSRTSLGAFAAGIALVRRLERIAVPCALAEGLAGNSILNVFRAQCDFMLEEGATPAAIDRAMESFGLAIGPFAAQDLAGLDIAYARRRRLAEMRDPLARDVPLIDRLCEAGRFGQKAGRGWYRYRDGKREADPEVEAMIRAHAAASGHKQSAFTGRDIELRIVAAMANEGARLVGEDIVTEPALIDLVMVHGFGFPAWHGGPMQAADAAGLRQIQSLAEASAQRDGTGFAVAPLLRDLVATGRNFASLNGA